MIESRVNGYVSWEVRSEQGVITKSSGGAYSNLVLNSGLELLKSTSGYAYNGPGNCQLGTSSTPPTPTDVGLGNRVSGQVVPTEFDFVTVSSSTVPRYLGRRGRYSFPPSSNVHSVPLAEMVFTTNTATPTSVNTYSRVLFKDSGGNPITITLLPTETLYISYETRFYMPTGDITGTFDVTLNGITSTHNYTARPFYASSSVANLSEFVNLFGPSAKTLVAYSNFVLGSETDNGTGTSLGNSTTVNVVGGTGVYERTRTYTYGLTVGNSASGITGFQHQTSGYQILVSPPIMKTSSMVATFNNMIRVSWTRGAPV